jgi:hypothetical protein
MLANMTSVHIIRMFTNIRDIIISKLGSARGQLAQTSQNGNSNENPLPNYTTSVFTNMKTSAQLPETSFLNSPTDTSTYLGLCRTTRTTTKKGKGAAVGGARDATRFEP